MFKKIISLILAVSVLLSMAVVNVNAEEVSAERVTNFENAVTLLKELGAISNEAYTFESEITKAQFVEMISKIVPVGDGAAEPLFSDVPATHANFKVIQGFADAGYINGYAGSFEPDRAITYNEALYIMLNAMGYADFMGLVAAYPAGGWDFARRLDIKMGNKGAIAGDILYMVYQTLAAEMFTISGLDKGNLKFTNEDGESLLETYCDITRATGILKTNGRITIDSQYEVDPETIVVDNDKYDISEECEVLPGCEVDVFYKVDTDDVVCVVATAKNKIVTISSKDIEKFKDLKYTYEEEGKTKTLKITVATDIVMNNVLAADGYDDAEMIPEDGFVIAVNGGTGNDFDVLYVDDYKSFVITGVSQDDEIGTICWETKKEGKLETVKATLNLEEGAPLMCDAEGNAITFEDINIGDVVSVLISDSVITKIVTSNAVVTGELTKIYDDEPATVIVDGQEYYVAASSKHIVDALAPQANVTFYVDFMGNIVGIDNAASGGMAFGYILKAKVDRNDEYEDCIKLELLSEIGSIIEYYLCPDKIHIDGKLYGRDYDPQTLLTEKFLKNDKVKEQLIRYDVNDEREINKIDFSEKLSSFEGTSSADNRLFEKYAVGTSDAYALNFASRKILGSTGRLHYGADTLIFKLPCEELKEDALPEEYQVIRDIGKLKNQGRYSVKSAYVLGEDSMYANIIVLTDSVTLYPDSSEYCIVKDVKQLLDEYNEVIYSITVDGISGEKTFNTKTARVAEEPHVKGKPGEAPDGGFRKVVPGDVIRYLLNAEGTAIVDIELIYDVIKGETTVSAGSSETEYRSLAKGYVYDMDDTYIGITAEKPEKDNLTFNEYETYKVDDFKIFKMEVGTKKAEEITAGTKKDIQSYKSNGGTCSEVLYIGSRGAGKLMIILE